MKKMLLLSLFLFGTASFLKMDAQKDTVKRYWVQFADRANSPYSVSAPGVFLSPRSIQRRLNHSIPITQNDLPVNPAYVDSLVAKGAHVHLRSKWFNGAVVKVYNPAVIKAIRQLPFVVDTSSVMPIAQFASSGGSEKLIPHTSSVSDLKTIPAALGAATLNYGPSLNQIDMLKGVCLHNAGFQGQGMIIAILDAGFYHANVLKAFDSLRANNQIIATHDFVAENSSVYEDHFHGMCVLSCMGGNLPGQLVGTAPKAKFLLVRTEQDSSEYVIEEYNWAAGAEYADSAGADVINTSLGYTTFDDARQSHKYADMNGHKTICARAANFAANKGLAVVCAEGNDGGDQWNYVGTPGDADSVLAVGAVDGSGVYANFSSHGPNSSGMVKPAVAAQGQGSVVADWNSNGTVLENGTSFASPIMCGLVACLWQAHPQVSNMELFKFIEQSADQFTGPDTLLGYGKPNFCSASLSMGIQENPSLEHDFLTNVHPNPFSSAFDFIFWSKSSQEAQITLFDLTGRIIRSERRTFASGSYNECSLKELSLLSAGMYTLSVRAKDANFVRKVVKE